MSEYAGILSLLPTGVLTNDCPSPRPWDGSEVGPIDDAVPIPCLVRVRLYRFPGGDYAILHPYSDELLNMERLKDAFGVPRTPYNVCTLNTSQFIAYVCEPDHESVHSFQRTGELSDSERLTLAFHWITKTSGRYWDYVHDERTTVYSGPPYRSVNLSKTIVDRLFPDTNARRNLYEFFSKPEKMRRVREVATRDSFLTIKESIEVLSGGCSS